MPMMTDIKVTEGDLVEVRFIDLLEVNEWTDLRNIRIAQAPQCKIAGYYLNEDDKVIRLVNFISEDGQSSYVIIPKGVITMPISKVEESEIDDFSLGE